MMSYIHANNSIKTVSNIFQNGYHVKWGLIIRVLLGKNLGIKVQLRTFFDGFGNNFS